MNQYHNILIKDIRIHGSTGYIEVDVVAVDDNSSGGRVGPLHTYGICPHEIKARYGGSVEVWLKTVKGMHQKHAGFHDDLVAQLQGWKGKRL